ncbi:MAG: type II toxin-antitoxin system RelE/ParE family toxin [Candidatus Polarisedimenticolaceae bacterium]|nr:type II toxin-antitoxin system RelE/ParE family toxin [Candidatus Polarisedimenticolaceae bacterium]
MVGYRFYLAANQRQDEIWRYTCEQRGEAQAEKYIRGLHSHIQELAERKRPWKSLPGSLVVPPDLDIDVFFSRYESHHLFFRELSNGVIGVMSILHEAMDFPVRLGEDLGRIDRGKHPSKPQ